MKPLLLSVLCITLCLTACSRRPGPPDSYSTSKGTSPKKIFVVSIGDVDQPLVSRVSQFMANELAVVPDIISKRPHISGPLDDQAVAVSSLISDNSGYLVALSAADADVKAHGAMNPEAATVVINTRALRPAESDTPHGREIYHRRVEKEAMRGLGYLLGLDSCPLPTCALCSYKTDAQLDAKGRNFCPPCQHKAHAALVAAGITPAREP